MSQDAVEDKGSQFSGKRKEKWDQLNAEDIKATRRDHRNAIGEMQVSRDIREGDSGLGLDELWLDI